MLNIDKKLIKMIEELKKEDQMWTN
jgi:hypothetical protein